MLDERSKNTAKSNRRKMPAEPDEANTEVFKPIIPNGQSKPVTGHYTQYLLRNNTKYHHCNDFKSTFKYNSNNNIVLSPIDDYTTGRLQQ